MAEVAKADVGKRILAALIDGFISHGILQIVFSIIPGVGNMVAYLISCVPSVVEDNIMGAGKSIGRKAMNQSLVMADGTPATHQQALIRNATTVALVFFSVGFIGLVDLGLVIFGDGRRVSDRIVGTVVVDDPG